jgi:hypothetical protein
MLELIKIRKDINWLIEQIKCLMNKSNLTTPLSATEWSTNHSLAEGNPYNKKAFTWYNGHVYESLVDDNQYPPTNATYWTDLGEGHQLLEEQSDWDATTGRTFIRNKPVLLEEAPDDGSQYVRKNEAWDKLTTYSAVNPNSGSNVAEGFPLGSDWYNTVTGEKFYHKANGVWISYTASTTPPIDNGDSPVMFADYATQTFLPNSPIYYNGPANDGIGATLTANAQTKLYGIVSSILPLTLGQTVLVKDENIGDFESGTPSDRPHNGVYIVTQEGCDATDLSGCMASPWVLTRIDYANEPGELFPSQVNILSGVNQNRFFLQQNVIDVIGDTEVVYEINYVPPTQVITLPVVHMDTATTAPLPSCTYLDEYAPPVGGIFFFAPTTSYLTATVNGPLGVINGVNVSNSVVLSNRKILVKDQADNKQNGDYEIIQNGSASQPWKLRRITTNYSSLNKNTREWKINNEACTLYGNRYYMNYNTASIGIIGTTPITFSELVAGGIQNLQDVTDIGNSTDNNIQFGTGAGLLFNNGSKVKEGITDAGLGGYKGVALVCSIDYELKWEAGRLYVMQQDGFTIREVSHNFTLTPTATDDITKGFVVGSRWLLDDGTLYVCTDNTDDTAVWELQIAGNQSLQDVTTIGNITTTEIISESGLIVNSADIPDSAAYLAKLGIFSILQSGTLRYGGSFELRETSADGSGNVALVLPSVLTEDRLLYLPNKNGTLAVTTDLDTKADLVAGKVPSSQLPSYVDDVIEGYYSAPTFYSNAGLTIPIVPETGKIYVDLLANKSYRWSGSVYIQISNAISSIDELTDVTIASPLNGQLLQYNLTTSQWENKTVTVGNGDMQKSTYDIDNDGIVDFAETIPVTVRNPSVSTILRKGTIVYLNGATGWRPNAYKAQANAEATSSGTFGVVLSDIATNSDGTVAMLGTIHTLDTRNAANGAPFPFTNDVLLDGDVLWLDPNNAGYVTRIKPQAPNHAVFIGVVARTHPSLGRIVYRITNGYELDELHNVFINGTLADKHTLYYDAATSLWKTNTIAGILGFNPAQLLTAVTVDSYIGSRLKPADTASNGFHFRKSINGSIGYVAYNSNTGNGAVATNGVGIDSTDDYTNNTYIAHFGTGYYVTQLAGQGALISTKTLFVGAVGIGDIDFVTGADYSTITSKFKVFANGQLKIGVTPATGSTSDFVLVRDSSGNVKQVAYPTVGVPFTRQEFTFTGSQSFTLSGTPSFIYGVFVEGQELDSSQYSSTGTTLTILNTLGTSDSVNILYTPTTAGVLEYYTKAEVDALLPTAYTPDINMINATKITLMYNT